MIQPGDISAHLSVTRHITVNLSIPPQQRPRRDPDRTRRADRVVLVLMVLLAGTPLTQADDPDNCLLCHRYRGLSRYAAATDTVHLYAVNPAYHRDRLGPHARIGCTDCHPRDEVVVIPHEPVSRVDCTKTCHLSDPTGLSRRFSHAGVAAALAGSVHAPETLNELSFADGPLLGDGQSACLYCHDEPMFRPLAEIVPHAAGHHAHLFDRCDTCHEYQVPVDVAYYARHVTSRMVPARRPLEMAQVCAVCHADATVVKHREISDAVASYVRSFHGKAALLGEVETADCISCHAAGGLGSHQILSRSDPRSATHADNVADSCRSPGCHPGAEMSLAQAAVHLNLPESVGSIEYGLAAAFILLTIFSFGPSLVIALLELFQIVIGRHHHSTRRALALTHAVLQHPQGRARLKRFTVNQRVQHWVLAVLFIVLVLTGFPMKFADAGWARAITDALGGLSVARLIHHWAGIALVLGLLLHLVYIVVGLVQRMRTPGPDGKRPGPIQAVNDLPMWVTPADGIKMLQLLGYLMFLRRDPPTFGRFSVKEKFEYIGVFWGTVLLGITGILLWGEQVASRYVSGRVLNLALIAHTYEAFLAIIHVGILHICNVMFAPNVFPLSPATITGDTPTEELAEMHEEFVTDAARDLGVEPEGGAS